MFHPHRPARGPGRWLGQALGVCKQLVGTAGLVFCFYFSCFPFLKKTPTLSQEPRSPLSPTPTSSFPLCFSQVPGSAQLGSQVYQQIFAQCPLLRLFTLGGLAHATRPSGAADPLPLPRDSLAKPASPQAGPQLARVPLFGRAGIDAALWVCQASPPQHRRLGWHCWVPPLPLAILAWRSGLQSCLVAEQQERPCLFLVPGLGSARTCPLPVALCLDRPMPEEWGRIPQPSASGGPCS